RPGDLHGQGRDRGDRRARELLFQPPERAHAHLPGPDQPLSGPTMPEPILMFEPLLEPIQSRLEAQYQVYKVGDPAVDARAGDIRVVVSGGATGMGSEWFDRLPNLGLVALNG